MQGKTKKKVARVTTPAAHCVPVVLGDANTGLANTKANATTKCTNRNQSTANVDDSFATPCSSSCNNDEVEEDADDLSESDEAGADESTVDAGMVSSPPSDHAEGRS